MDKLQMAHDYAMEMAKQGIPLKSCKELGWKYADAMQAEAEKRVNKERPEVLKEEWKPDWSQAPDNAKYWAMDKDHTANFFRNKPEITNGNGWDFGSVMQSNNTHTYQGNWQDSLRKRPEALCEVDWSAAPKNAFQWQMINNEAYWRIEIMGGLDTEPAPSFGFTGSHIMERPQ